jgi:hypothetical protein
MLKRMITGFIWLFAIVFLEGIALYSHGAELTSLKLLSSNRILVHLKTHKGFYIVAEKGGGGPVFANRRQAREWETFTLIDINGGQLMSGDRVNLMTYDGKHYLVAEGGGGREVKADRTKARQWETFTISKISGNGTINYGDKISLQAHNGQYMVAEGGGGGPVNANRSKVGEWEKFVLIKNGTFREVSGQIESKVLIECNMDSKIPDIVERWAPEIWHDYAVSKCDPSITNVDFDSDWTASNNSHFKKAPLGAVYYSLVQSPTHYFIGYYFYHPSDCSEWFDGGGHDNDWEGVVIALNRKSNMPDAMLTNYHGSLLSYYPPYNAPALAKKAEPVFTLVEKRVKTLKFLTVGVGVEARTHATWGQWNHNCVIGPKYGKTSGCKDKGGDGFIYTYKGYGEEPKNFNQYPNWKRYGYRLIDIEILFKRAFLSKSCGQDSFHATFRCDEYGLPWSIMNGGGVDAGALPWIWGETGENHCQACEKSSILLDPATIFWKKFSWKPQGFFWKKARTKANYPGPSAVNKYLFLISKCNWK